MKRITALSIAIAFGLGAGYEIGKPHPYRSLIVVGRADTANWTMTCDDTCQFAFNIVTRDGREVALEPGTTYENRSGTVSKTVERPRVRTL